MKQRPIYEHELINLIKRETVKTRTKIEQFRGQGTDLSTDYILVITPKITFKIMRYYLYIIIGNYVKQPISNGVNDELYEFIKKHLEEKHNREIKYKSLYDLETYNKMLI